MHIIYQGDLLKNILIVFGGNSFEHEVSIKSASNIYNFIDKSLFNVNSLYISKEGIWYEFNNDFKNINIKNLRKIYNIIEYLKRYDLVFNIIHGYSGEDGKLQSLFELFELKYIGPDSYSSFVCMNKIITKLLLEANNIKTTKFVIYKTIKDTIKNLKFPMVVKPSDGGSSCGVSIVNNIGELKQGIKEAKKYSFNILVEEYIKGRELECAILENNNKLIVSKLGEIVVNKNIYSYEDKYVTNKSMLITPTSINYTVENSVKNIAKKAFNICKCKGLARIDFLYDEINNKIYLNEINTLPGFTDISMYPKLLSLEGYNYTDLLTIIINNELNS